MARETRNKSTPAEDPQAQEEMTVVVLKFKGGSQSLQKGFDAVSQAIAMLGGAQQNNYRVVSTRPAQLAATNGEIIDQEGEQDVEEGEVVNGTPAETAPLPRPRKPQAAPKYTFLKEFSLTPAGVPSLVDYCTQRNPQTENDKFLVASAWISTHGGLEAFTGAHLFTAFRAMDWKTQADMTQPLRTMKSKKSYYDNPGGGKWQLTPIGLKAAEAIGK
jgi:hypothetical protein